MMDLLRAEWKKLIGNRMLAGFTIWLYPVGLFAFILVMGLLFLLGGNVEMEMSPSWTGPMLAAWDIITRFPTASISRLPLLAFMAVMVAGEYEWGTWKSLVPRRSRRAILLTKIVTMALLVVMAIGLTSLISGPVRYGTAHLLGIETEGGLPADERAAFLEAYALETGLAFIQSLFLACFATLSALLTRTIVGSLLLSFGLSMLEMLAPILMTLLSRLLEKPDIVNAYAYFPGYLIDNLRSWLLHDSPLYTGLPAFTNDLNAGTSALLLAGLLAGFIALCLWLFQRQDITS